MNKQRVAQLLNKARTDVLNEEERHELEKILGGE